VLNGRILYASFPSFPTALKGTSCFEKCQLSIQRFSPQKIFMINSLPFDMCHRFTKFDASLNGAFTVKKIDCESSKLVSFKN